MMRPRNLITNSSGWSLVSSSSQYAECAKEFVETRYLLWPTGKLDILLVLGDRWIWKPQEQWTPPPGGEHGGGIDD